MKILNLILPALCLTLLMYTSLSCTEAENSDKVREIRTTSGAYTVYIVNSNLHTGIIIPLDKESTQSISALKNFSNFRFADIGWGEEKFYQDPKDSFCMGARAVLLPNRSVIRVEGYLSFTEEIIGWSDYTVMLNLTGDQYIRLLSFIENSFVKDSGNSFFITSQKHSGEIIFFKSVYSYHLFNTCNTWIAEALESSGLDVSPFLIITAGQLYDEIKDCGKVLKALK